MKMDARFGSVTGSILCCFVANLVERRAPWAGAALVISASLAATRSISFINSTVSFSVRPCSLINRSPGMMLTLFVFKSLQQNEFVATFDSIMNPSNVIL